MSNNDTPVLNIRVERHGGGVAAELDLDHVDGITLDEFADFMPAAMRSMLAGGSRTPGRGRRGVLP